MSTDYSANFEYMYAPSRAKALFASHRDLAGQCEKEKEMLNYVCISTTKDMDRAKKRFIIRQERMFKKALKVVRVPAMLSDEDDQNPSSPRTISGTCRNIETERCDDDNDNADHETSMPISVKISMRNLADTTGGRRSSAMSLDEARPRASSVTSARVRPSTATRAHVLAGTWGSQTADQGRRTSGASDSETIGAPSRKVARVSRSSTATKSIKQSLLARPSTAVSSDPDSPYGMRTASLKETLRLERIHLQGKIEKFGQQIDDYKEAYQRSLEIMHIKKKSQLGLDKEKKQKEKEATEAERGMHPRMNLRLRFPSHPIYDENNAQSVNTGELQGCSKRDTADKVNKQKEPRRTSESTTRDYMELVKGDLTAQTLSDATHDLPEMVDSTPDDCVFYADNSDADRCQSVRGRSEVKGRSRKLRPQAGIRPQTAMLETLPEHKSTLKSGDRIQDKDDVQLRPKTAAVTLSKRSSNPIRSAEKSRPNSLERHTSNSNTTFSRENIMLANRQISSDSITSARGMDSVYNTLLVSREQRTKQLEREQFRAKYQVSDNVMLSAFDSFREEVHTDDLDLLVAFAARSKLLVKRQTQSNGPVMATVVKKRVGSDRGVKAFQLMLERSRNRRVGLVLPLDIEERQVDDKEVLRLVKEMELYTGVKEKTSVAAM